MYFGQREGSWWLRSKDDPRWNADGRDVCGGGEIPDECARKIEELKKVLGAPPADLRWGCMKD